MRFERTQSSQSGGSSSFLKLENNITVNGIVRGDPLKFYMDWPKGGEKKIFDKPTPGASARYKINLIVFEDGKFVAKVWEYPPMVSGLLADLLEAGHNLDQTKIQIKKIKKGDMTTYSVVTLAGEKDKLTAKHLKEIDAVELHPLVVVPTNGASASERAKVKNFAPGGDDADDDSEVPF